MGKNAREFSLACFVLVSLTAGNAFGDDFDRPAGERTSNWYVQAGTYVHYSDHRDYAGTPWFVGIEYHDTSRRITGLSLFNNSFDQQSQYVYIGKSFHLWDKYPNVRFKLTGGILHGYDGKHQNMSPINWGDGWALGVVPGFGYQDGRLGIDVAFLSAAGVLFLVGYEF